MTAGNHLPHRRLTNSHVHSPRAQPLFRLSLAQPKPPAGSARSSRSSDHRRIAPGVPGIAAPVEIVKKGKTFANRQHTLSARPNTGPCVGLEIEKKQAT